MLSVVVLFGLSLTLVAAEIQDFDTHSGNLEFIYHDRHHLLLTLYDGPDADGHQMEACYFSMLDPAQEENLMGPYRSMVEGQVANTIRLNEKDAIAQTSLSEMRDLHQDLLADYHCRGRDIYTLELDYLYCTFDAGICSWEQSYMESMEWLRHSGPTNTGGTGPDRDHTNPPGGGYYMYLEANDGQPGYYADLMSPIFTLDKPMCLRFWYFMYGSSLGSLQVYQFSGTGMNFIFNLTEDRGQSWRKAEIPLLPDASAPVTRLAFRASKGHNIYGDIAIDDVSASPGVCTASRIDCDFEKNGRDAYCQWHLGEIGAMDWRPHRGPTETANTGPDSDHTIADGQKGQYLYVEANDGDPQDHAVLVSPVLDLNEPICMDFFYHMKGISVGQLSVFVKDLQRNTESILWSISGDQGEDWKEVSFTVIAPNDTPYTQIVFRATRGDSIESDIAIDDISGHPGPCVSTLPGGR